MGSGKNESTDADWWNPATEVYEYVVTVRAVETFKNVMKKLGVEIPVAERVTKFTSTNFLDMKGLKRRGLISSYVIVRATTVRRLIEQSGKD